MFCLCDPEELAHHRSPLDLAPSRCSRLRESALRGPSIVGGVGRTPRPHRRHRIRAQRLIGGRQSRDRVQHGTPATPRRCVGFWRGAGTAGHDTRGEPPSAGQTWSSMTERVPGPASEPQWYGGVDGSSPSEDFPLGSPRGRRCESACKRSSPRRERALAITTSPVRGAACDVGIQHRVRGQILVNPLGFDPAHSPGARASAPLSAQPNPAFAGFRPQGPYGIRTRAAAVRGRRLLPCLQAFPRTTDVREPIYAPIAEARKDSSASAARATSSGSAWP